MAECAGLMRLVPGWAADLAQRQLNAAYDWPFKNAGPTMQAVQAVGALCEAWAHCVKPGRAPSVEIAIRRMGFIGCSNSATRHSWRTVSVHSLRGAPYMPRSVRVWPSEEITASQPAGNFRNV